MSAAPNTTPVSPTNQQIQQRPQQGLMDFLMEKRSSLATVAAKGVDVEKFVRYVGLAMAREPKIALCTRLSVIQAVTTAVQLGLRPDGVMGSAYLIPFREDGQLVCQFMAGYRGLIDLARRSGEVVNIEARVVYKGEKFKVAYGTDPYIQHEPNLGEQKDEDIVAFYAIGFIQGRGGAEDVPQFEVMTKAQVDKIRHKCKAPSSPGWVGHYPEMGRKTAVRRVVKYLPLSPEVEEHIRVLDEAERPLLGDAEFDRDLEAAKSRTDEVLAKVQRPAGPPPAAPTTKTPGRTAPPPSRAPEPDEELSPFHPSLSS